MRGEGEWRGGVTDCRVCSISLHQSMGIRRSEWKGGKSHGGMGEERGEGVIYLNPLLTLKKQPTSLTERRYSVEN